MQTAAPSVRPGPVTEVEVALVPLLVAVATPIAGPVGGRVWVLGWSIRETTGAASAQVIMRNGTDATGLEVAAVNLNPSESVRDWFGGGVLSFDNGFFPVVTGAVAGAVWVALGHGAER